MKDTNRNQITVETWAVAEVFPYLEKAASKCGMTADHLATVFLLEAIENRMRAAGEGRLATRGEADTNGNNEITISLDERLAKALDETCKRHNNCTKGAMVRYALREVLKMGDLDE